WLSDYFHNNFQQNEKTLKSRERLNSRKICTFLLEMRKYTGMNFVDLITERRIKKAKKSLSSTQLKTYEIAYLIKFSESRYFSQLFKKNIGCTSKEYREKAENKPSH